MAHSPHLYSKAESQQFILLHVLDCLKDRVAFSPNYQSALVSRIGCHRLAFSPNYQSALKVAPAGYLTRYPPAGVDTINCWSTASSLIDNCLLTREPAGDKKSACCTCYIGGSGLYAVYRRVRHAFQDWSRVTGRELLDWPIEYAVSIQNVDCSGGEWSKIYV